MCCSPGWSGAGSTCASSVADGGASSMGGSDSVENLIGDEYWDDEEPPTSSQLAVVNSRIAKLSKTLKKYALKQTIQSTQISIGYSFLKPRIYLQIYASHVMRCMYDLYTCLLFLFSFYPLEMNTATIRLTTTIATPYFL